MMHHNRFVMAIRVNGKILREYNQAVYLPFGAEYELILKNLNSRRAMVGVSIDGKRTSDCRFVIPANDSITLERYINKGNLDSGNKFKFIERTAAVEAHRGIGSDDGLVRAEFWAEREAPKIQYTTTTYPGWKPGRRRSDLDGPWMRSSLGGIRGQSVDSDFHIGFNSFAPTESEQPFSYTSAQASSTQPGSTVTVNQAQMNASIGAMNKLADVNDAGITVPGGISNQQFHHTSGFELETSSTVIVLQLRGERMDRTVTQPITVATKPVCITCGKTNKATSKFCSECGTGLQLI